MSSTLIINFANASPLITGSQYYKTDAGQVSYNPPACLAMYPCVFNTFS
jgi:hypothetical protein